MPLASISDSAISANFSILVQASTRVPPQELFIIPTGISNFYEFYEQKNKQLH